MTLVTWTGASTRGYEPFTSLRSSGIHQIPTLRRIGQALCGNTGALDGGEEMLQGKRVKRCGEYHDELRMSILRSEFDEHHV